MKYLLSICLLSVLFLFSFATFATAQEEAMPPAAVPSPELEILKHEVGKWDAAITFWMPGGPDEGVKSTGSEVNQMIGEFWMASQFDYEAFGQKFGGHGMFGYDVENEHYVGTWYSSDSPNPVPMVGKWDEESKTMTYEMDGVDGTGNPMKGKVMTTYNDDTHKTFEMHIDMGDGALHKMMEVIYTKK